MIAITVHDDIISVILVRLVKIYIKNAITFHDNIITIIASDIGK